MTKNCNNPISVIDFGAKGDGKTDDTKAFNKAVEFCKKNVQNLFIPKGNYVIQPVSQTKISFKNKTVFACINLEETDDISIQGEQGTTLLIKGNNLQKATIGVGISLLGRSNIKIQNITLQPFSYNKKVNELISGVIIQDSNNIVLENISINNLEEGIKLITSNDCLIKECVIYDCIDTGLNFFKGCTNCIASYCKIGGCKDGNATMYGKNERCGFVHCTFSGRQSAKQLAVIESSSQCYISDCIFDGEDNIGSNGPILNRSQFCIISNNIIKDVHYGMIVRNTDIAGAKGVFSYGNVLSNNSIFYVHQKIPNQQPIGCWIEYSNNTRIEGNTFYRVEGPQIKFFNRKQVGQNIGSQNANTLIKNNSFILKNSHLGKGLRASYFCQDQPIIYWNGSQPLQNMNFSDNTIFSHSACKKYPIDIKNASGCIFSQNVFQDPNKIIEIPLFINLGEGNKNTISNNTAGKIQISGVNNGLKIVNNNLSSKDAVIELTAELNQSLIAGNTFSGKSVIKNYNYLNSVNINSNFLLKNISLGVEMKKSRSATENNNNIIIKDNISSN